MRALFGVVLMFLAFGAYSQELGAYSQEYEARSEFTYCTLNKGKTLEDVIEQSELYGEFSTKAGTKYLQVV